MNFNVTLIFYYFDVSKINNFINIKCKYNNIYYTKLIINLNIVFA